MIAALQYLYGAESNTIIKLTINTSLYQGCRMAGCWQLTVKCFKAVIGTLRNSHAFLLLTSDCQNESERMSSMPQGMFSARKIRENEERMVLARMSKGEGYVSHKYFNTKCESSFYLLPYLLIICHFVNDEKNNIFFIIMMNIIYIGK